MGERLLFLGVDGGGTGCRARLGDASGAVLGEGVAGPANIRVSLEESLRSVMDAASRSLAQAGASFADPIVACLALAGASEPREAAAAYQACKGHFRRVIVTTDAHAACVGAHEGRDGGIIIVGTGSIGWSVSGGASHRVGGWGFPVSDEGGGAWLGCEAARRTLWAHDGRAAWTPLLRAVSQEFGADPHAIVRWMGAARPRDFARLAPLVVEHAAGADPAATELMRRGAGLIDAIAARLVELGAPRLALMGGLAAAIAPRLGTAIRARLIPPAGDALDGALQIATGADGTNGGRPLGASGASGVSPPAAQLISLQGGGREGSEPSERKLPPVIPEAEPKGRGYPGSRRAEPTRSRPMKNPWDRAPPARDAQGSHGRDDGWKDTLGGSEPATGSDPVPGG